MARNPSLEFPSPAARKLIGAIWRGAATHCPPLRSLLCPSLLCRAKGLLNEKIFKPAAFLNCRLQPPWCCTTTSPRIAGSIPVFRCDLHSLQLALSHPARNVPPEGGDFPVPPTAVRGWSDSRSTPHQLDCAGPSALGNPVQSDCAFLAFLPFVFCAFLPRVSPSDSLVSPRSPTRANAHNGKGPGCRRDRGLPRPWGKGCLPLRTHEAIASANDGSRRHRRDLAEAARLARARTCANILAFGRRARAVRLISNACAGHLPSLVAKDCGSTTIPSELQIGAPSPVSN